MKKILSLFILYFTLTWTVVAQIPPAPQPPRLVNDFAGLFSEEEKQTLEARLVAFNDSTTNVICVVCVKDLNGYTAQDFAYEIGDKWGVKDKKYNNGVVVLIKPKNNSKGEVAIQVGYALESAIPDACAKKIIEHEMIPHFKENDYYGGVLAAVDVICPLAAGEISEKKLYTSDDGSVIGYVLFIVILLFAIVLTKMGKGKGGNNGDKHNEDKDKLTRAAFWTAIFSSNADKQRHGGNSFGNGGFGGSGGFGGGGASGTW